MLREDMNEYIERHREEAYHLLLTLAKIPAPSNHEEKRAEFCETWLRQQGAKGVYVDEAMNVVYAVDLDSQKPVQVFMAHMDVVFPDTVQLPLKVEDGRIYCPGVGDDTACLVCLLMAAKYIAQHAGTPAWEEIRGPKAPAILLVCNSGEEGLGNLRGSRKICQDYGERIETFCSFDSPIAYIVDRAVGSRRFRVTARTQGGHSFNDFGHPSAVGKIAGIVQDLYRVQVPEGGKTTYNVGMISGGTSVNTIAQEAEILYEFRSDQRENLDYMQKRFEEVLYRARQDGTEIEAVVIGERPCEGETDPDRRKALTDRAVEAVTAVTGHVPKLNPGSTDCNIPMSLGIPSICVGCYRGAGAHTRQEYVEIDSLEQGYKVAFEMILGRTTPWDPVL